MTTGVVNKIAMIPARMGSQRLKHKNLRILGGESLIVRAVRKCREAGVFDEIWVNSENEVFGEIARREQVEFHLRPAALGDHTVTSEEYIAEFLEEHSCDLVFQVHTIAPLLPAEDVKRFVEHMEREKLDCLLSGEEIQIECMFRGQPVNFTFSEKTNSQDLTPVQRISWGITGWRRDTFLANSRTGQCATYSGRIGFFPLGRLAAHVIKTDSDLRLAESLLSVVEDR